MPTIKVDGQDIEVKAGDNLLAALLSAGINIPYFCWHPAMGSIGACRQCAVVGYANEDDTRGRIVMSCMTPVADGAIYSVSTKNATEFRSSVIENLMLNHPHDCPVCEEGGECHLQDMTVMAGHKNRRYTGLKTTFRNQYLGPFIGHEMNRCITCYRCTRFYQDYAGGHDLSAFASRDRVFFGRSEEGLLENEFSGNLVEVCPTGVFTDKTLARHYTRKWDLQSAPTVCTGCSLGCNTYTSERYGQVRRVHNRFHHDINGYFLCDRGRFGAGFVNAESRIPQAGIRNKQGTYDAVELPLALDKARQLMNASQHMIGIGSPRASLESNQALRELVGPENYCNGMNDLEREMHGIILDVIQSQLNFSSLAGIQSYDAVLVLGEDTTNHAPCAALSIRQATRNKAFELGADTQLAPWQDAAVRELAQHDQSPLVIVTPTADRLDEAATLCIRLGPAQIAKLGFEIAACLESQQTDSEKSAAQQIAEILKNAKRPLIISGTSLANPDILRAAANLGATLNKLNPESAIFLAASESNSIGVALLDNEQSLNSLLAAKPDLAIVLENDLAIRLGHQFDETIKTLDHLIVIDHLDNATVSVSDVVLPAATFAESEATLVNNEGRAQRSFAVYKAEGDIQASYHLIDALACRTDSTDNAMSAESTLARNCSQIRDNLVEQHPALVGILAAAPEADFRVYGSKLSRMTARASGRTAQLAHVSVHEPMQPVDDESAMAFTMEGNSLQAPASLRAFTWSPGWNSNQSIHKFQQEVGGSDKTGDPGKLLFQSSEPLQSYVTSVNKSRTIIHKHHIFGSEELSVNADELSQLIPRPYISLNSASAASLNVSSGDGVICQTTTGNLTLAVIIDDDLDDHCLVVPILPSTRNLATLTSIELSRAENWQSDINPLSPALITTDRTS